jgi:hypothetical protein
VVCRNRKWVPLTPQATNLFDFRKMLPRKTMPVLVLGMQLSLFRVSFARLTTMGEAMKEAVHAKPLKTGEKATDTEHDLQLQLIDSLADSIEKAGDFSPAGTFWTS